MKKRIVGWRVAAILSNRCGLPVGVIVLAMLISNCEPTANKSKPQSTQSTKSAKPLPSDSEAVLTHKIARLETRLGKATNEIRSLKQQIEWSLKPQIESIQNRNTSAVLDPSEKGYVYVKSPSGGRFLIACEDIKPFLDGQKVKLKVGSPDGVEYSGLKLKIKWGPREPIEPPFDPEAYLAEYDKTPTTDASPVKTPDAFDKWYSDHKIWEGEIREKEFDSTAELRPGYWSYVEVTLPATKAENATHLEVSISTNLVRLAEPDRSGGR